MTTKVVYKVREEKKEFQKQFGCMNGLFQLFDRRYLLGLHRNGRNQKMLTPGEGENGKKEIKNSSEKDKEINTKRAVIEKNRVSIESSRNSFSSSCSSTTFSSLDCSKRVHMEMQLPSLPTSPKLRKNQQDCSLPDIRDVVKNSMTRTIRVASVKDVEKEMKHIDSPRPFVKQKSVEFEYERKDRNLAREASRLSCDERESKYSLKSSLKVKEVPRLSLDSKQIKNSKNTLDQTQEPGSNKRPSSGVVARLMGLEGFQDSNLEIETLKKTKIPFLDHELVSRFKKMEVKNRSFSVYGEMEKRLSGIEFKTSGKDLRALKQILEGIKNKEQPLENKKKVKPVNGTRRELVKPVKLTLTKVNHGENGNDSFGRKKVKDLTPRKKKVAGGTPRLVACSNSPEKLTGERKKSKKVSSDLTRIKKQSNSKNPKTKMKNKEESCNETRNDKPKEDHKDNFVERLIEEKETPIVDLPKLTIEQPSPVSVLDVFYTEDTPSPINKKDTDFNDYEALDFEENQETEWNQVEDYSDFKLNFFNSTNEEHEYISEILLTSGFLKDIESAIRIVQIHPMGSLIKPDLFHFLEKKERYTELTDDECHKKNEKLKRKLIFDSVNDILLKKLVILGSFDMWSGKKRGGLFLNGEMLLKELCSEIDNLQTTPERCVYDEDDEVKNLVSVDVNKSADWGKCCYEVPGVVLDIERLIFKDLIDEVVNADMAPHRQCRRLFPM
ncbi:unnamed protein product [Lactuca virosa]|uniref:DUF4378 domain-containing protein n=1 Tax=Lactuca virosa TaxID=75947 RepID=A0AAU9M8J4_9ASTR|nr:unnamed protein product [Lactuca virosa]